IPILDRDRRVIGVISPPPMKDNERDWATVNSDAVSALEEERDGAPHDRSNKRTKNMGLNLEEEHRRGDFKAKGTGFSASGGMEYAKCVYHDRKTAKALRRLQENPTFIRIAGHASAIFATWAPNLYTFYGKYMDQVLEHNPSIYYNFPNSIFASATYNFGPWTVLLEHIDHLNYIYGWCSITAFGSYDFTKGGHLILFDLRMVIEFPPCWTILIPSSYLRHGNTDIAPGEKRFSFTQYTSGSLFRYVDDHYRMRTQMSPSERKETELKQRERMKADLNLYSTLDELKDLYHLV
ncbi:hypothetical protein K435DRAFT_694257, partial [Dendrothele bispora CBS 962.96]